MDRIKDILKRGESLSDEDRELLVRLVWLMERTDERHRMLASARIDTHLQEDETGWPAFLEQMRQLVVTLSVAMQREDSAD